MIDSESSFAVALTKCFYCGEDNEIVINKKLTKKAAQAVREMDGKVADLTPCDKCKKWMKQGVIILTIDTALSGDDWQTRDGFPNPYRTGGFFVMSEDWIKRVLDDDLQAYALKNRWVYMEHEAAVALGLFKGDQPEETGEDNAEET